MKYYVLYNPLAGNGTAEDSINHLPHDPSAEIVKCDVTKIDCYADFFSKLDAEDVIILCGGDGTLNRFINGTDGLTLPSDVLYFPAGSGNDFLTDVEKTKEESPFSIKEYIKDLPTVTIKDKTYRFINNVGFGIDGYCCEVGDKKKAESTKKVDYTSIAINGLLFHYEPTNATIIIDGVEHKFKKVWLAPTMKGRFYGGGMMVAPTQDRTSGLITASIFHGGTRIKTLAVLPKIYKGRHIEHKEMVDFFPVEEMKVEFDIPTALQIDGDTISGVLSYTVRTAKKHEEYLARKKKSAVR